MPARTTLKCIYRHDPQEFITDFATHRASGESPEAEQMCGHGLEALHFWHTCVNVDELQTHS